MRQAFSLRAILQTYEPWALPRAGMSDAFGVRTGENAAFDVLAGTRHLMSMLEGASRLTSMWAKCGLKLVWFEPDFFGCNSAIADVRIGTFWLCPH
jgi:hypothetical protein